MVVAEIMLIMIWPAGMDDDSWKSQFEASKNFDSVKTQIAGLGEIDAIQQLYVAHTKAAMDAQ